MLTVVFSTYNGADTLPLMLDAFTRLEQPPGGWKLVAVNNASTDATPRLLAEYGNQLPLTVLEQPIPGKSSALNLALDSGVVEGDLAVFTDDDIIPDPRWLVNWRRCANAHPEFSFFGGRILPYWLKEPPYWVEKAIPLGVAYAATRPAADGPVDPVYVTGPNMAVRTAVLQTGARFDETKGPAGQRYAMGEDTAFAYMLASMGYSPFFCTDPVVGHIVHSSQFEIRWLLSRAFRYGQGRCSLDLANGIDSSQSRRLLGVPRWMLKQYVKDEFNAWLWCIRRDKVRYMANAWNARYLAGYLVAYRHIANEFPGGSEADVADT